MIYLSLLLLWALLCCDWRKGEGLSFLLEEEGGAPSPLSSEGGACPSFYLANRTIHSFLLGSIYYP